MDAGSDDTCWISFKPLCTAFRETASQNLQGAYFIARKEYLVPGYTFEELSPKWTVLTAQDMAKVDHHIDQS